ncbi:MAG: hypothetical protein GY899_11825 [Verrucomicrobiaceae bacterium]|nr:hypothetical protein [Verrucomicrobiaceae bacterium]
MSFSFRKLFKKSEQDSGVERTRLQFSRPQGQDLSSNENDSSAVEPEGLAAEGVVASPLSSPGPEEPSRVSEGSAQTPSPFQIVDAVSAMPEVSGSSQGQPCPSAETLFPSDVEVSGPEGELTQAENSGLFDAAPKPTVEPTVVGFYESVMENETEVPEGSPDSFLPGASSPDKSSPLQDPAFAHPRDALAPGGSSDLDAGADSREPSWVDDLGKDRAGASPFSTVPSDSDLETHEESRQDSVGEIETGRNAGPEGGLPFPTTGSVPDALESETEDNGLVYSAGGGEFLSPEPSYSSQIPDGSEQSSGFPPPSAEVEKPEDIGTSGHFPAFLENQDFSEEEDAAPGQDFPTFPPSGQDNITGEGQLGEGHQAGGNHEPIGFGDFSANDNQGMEQGACHDHIDPEPLSLPTDPLSGSGLKQALAEAGPWPLGEGVPSLKAHSKSPEPLESLSPLATESSDIPQFVEPAGDFVPDQHTPQPAGASHGSSMVGQPTLRALLMTDADIDGGMVVRHCADLEGVHLCVASTTDGRIKASSMPDGAFEIDVMGLLGSVRNLAKAFGAGLEGPLTLRSVEGFVSFFVSGNACLGILHAEGALESGVQERLWLITGALDAECK